MKLHRLMLLSILSALLPLSLHAQTLSEMVFHNRDIRDILQVLGAAANLTILSDQTVDGTSSFQSPNIVPEEALFLFLEQERLYWTRKHSIVRISRINLTYDTQSRINLEAEDVLLQDIVLAIARTAPQPVLFDALPRERITIKVIETELEETLNTLILRFPDYELIADGNSFYVQSKPSTSDTTRRARGSVVRQGEMYSVEVDNVRFRDVIDELFRLGEREYSYLGRNEGVLTRISFKPRDFDAVLTLLAEQVKVDFLKVGELYYIFDNQQSNVLARYQTAVYHPLEYISASSALQLLPVGLVGQGDIREDKRKNSLILYGSLGKIASIQSYLSILDQPIEGREWTRYNLDYLSTSDLNSILPPELRSLELTPIAGTSSILVSVTENQHQALAQFLMEADKPSESYPVKLRYITSEELKANIPPPFTEKDINVTQDSSLVFFNGNRDKLAYFRRMLDTMDKPVSQIRYDLLVVNYQDTQGFNWSSEAKFSEADSSQSNQLKSFSGNISPLMNLSFDVVTNFGVQFALKLSAGLESQESTIAADTTLNGLSGEKIQFRNTNTSRYRDYRLDSNTNTRVSEGAREITSGLLIDIEGWVSGDNMITMDIRATMSRQSDSNKNSTEVLPSTTERSIATNIRTPAGKPIIISGLTQQMLQVTEEKTPILGSIPLLGWLFKKQIESYEDTELVIYIIAHVDNQHISASDENVLFERIYTKYLER
ncbi:hypothetical protein S1OALGB6SA_875 [Olavius algarvensis spirochete endosymbiont]|uniref:hypothetical protein n=1 Tax=Olavius algarvensis spirochete endosymbiont TaxID=260710 RepID=UPI000F246A2E|nr:hypothetical protein [Olavius algarvensis spirochete endosymbiont]VDA99802.1 hypothetical protein S1OALGB6SA_875 [Olavius algarvensis spirochete endosymbiont]